VHQWLSAGTGLAFNFDGPVKSRETDDKVKSYKGKARKS
jgi:hypothetical protein